MDKYLHTNGSGDKDKTAGQALENISTAENEIDNIAAKQVQIIKMILDTWGFELIERVKIRHKKSGREYR